MFEELGKQRQASQSLLKIDMMKQEESFKARLAKRNRGMGGGRSRLGSVKSAQNIAFKNKLKFDDSSSEMDIEMKGFSVEVNKESEKSGKNSGGNQMTPVKQIDLGSA